MRWRGSTLAAALLATGAVLSGLLGAPPVAQAKCAGAGTLPPGDPTLVIIEAAGRTFYVDDRGVAGRGTGGGLFLYAESNGKTSLQTGGPHTALAAAYSAGLPAHIPRTGLFPLPTDGQTWHGATGLYDGCSAGGSPDTLLL